MMVRITNGQLSGCRYIHSVVHFGQSMYDNPHVNVQELQKIIAQKYRAHVCTAPENCCSVCDDTVVVSASQYYGIFEIGI